MRPLLALFLCSWALAGAPLSGDKWLILPLHNASADANLEWIGDSVAEVIAEPFRALEIGVVSRTVVDEVSRRLDVQPRSLLTKASVMMMGRHSGATHVLYGKFEHVPAAEAPENLGSLEVEISIINLRGLMTGPTLNKTDRIANLAEFQSLLAWHVLQYAAPGEALSEEAFLERYPPVRIDAMENYVRGLLASDLENKHRLYTRAVNLDPEFAAPCFELGRMHWEESSYRVAAGWLERVGDKSSRYPQATFLLGLCYYLMGRHAQAQQTFNLLTGSRATAAVYNNLGLAHYRLGAAEAIDFLRWASEQDPEDPDLHFNAGYLLWRDGDFAGAARRFERVLAIDPSDSQAKLLLERCRNQTGPRRGDIRSEGLERLKENYEPSPRFPLMSEKVQD